MKVALVALGAFVAYTVTEAAYIGLLAVGLSETASTATSLSALTIATGVLGTAGCRTWRAGRKVVTKIHDSHELLHNMVERVDGLENSHSEIRAALHRLELRFVRTRAGDHDGPIERREGDDVAET